ncbi:MAG: YitT family protein [Bacilli bacterium]
MEDLDFSKVVEKIRSKKLFKRYFLLTLALFISSLSFNLFFLKTGIVAGGASGLSIILERAFGFSPSLVIFIISLTALVISFLFLGIEKTSGMVVATFVYPFFVQLTSPFANYITIASNDMILISLIGGLLTGVTTGIILKIGFSGGGLNVISQILYKKFNLSMSKTISFVNAVIVILGGIYFGFTNAMYALIVIYISSIVIDKIILGISRNKAFYIITDEEKEVKDYIINTLHHSVTLLNAKGGFLQKKQYVLMAVVPTSEYYQLTEGIKLIDPQSFFVVVDSYEVSGGA